ncbi:NUDIX hydrolase [Parahaliea mediterranea]|uniref:NUDIX hydrolase n=1 Tax=Parahaliea mediterranea TaxID=651086 RepID=A0A939INM7_9GAMM|nr:NUDIX hydrolase [Parahaliea mediterranea]MBN7798212.1 NUDIX hydrolase [Parahaliea mediterranea]
MRPVDAATLIILRDQREVLMGLRSAKHVFVPNNYVFPGGRVDPGDARVPAPFELNTTARDRLVRSTSPSRARGIGMAAVRETFEETGLLLTRPTPAPVNSRSASWRPIYQQGVAPALDRLHYFARAITPPGPPRRFDARFFLADARHLQGTLRGNGELHDLRWVPLEEAAALPMIGITQVIIELLRRTFAPAAVNRQHDTALRQVMDEVMNRELVEHHRPCFSDD